MYTADSALTACRESNRSVTMHVEDLTLHHKPLYCSMRSYLHSHWVGDSKHETAWRYYLHMYSARSLL
jgi:hypothetical protein